ncbi:MAG: alpha/beta hydrolase [Acidimicrobiales bacterium]
MRFPRKRALVAGVLAGIVVAASACSGAASPRPGTTTGSPPQVRTTLPPTATIAWRACAGHDGWQCGTLAVPLDHAHPGPTISIALTRHLATARSSRIGSLLVNPGGPGVSGITFAYEMPATGIFDQLLQRFDVVGFDPRGVGASTPVRCVDGATLDRLGHLDPSPTTPAELDALVAGARELAAACEQQSAGLLPRVSTVDAAQDMDDIRAALGDSGLTYLGFSYGTLLGATYASLFPTHVRALALDSAIDPAVDEGAMSVAQAVGFEQNLNAFLAACTTKCVFTRHGAPTLRAAFDALMARIDSAPLPAGLGRTLGPGEALFGVADPLYAEGTWPALAGALEAAEGGDGTGLMSFYDEYSGRHADGSYDNSLEANTAINCADHAPPPSVPAFQALAAAAAKQAPYFGAPVAWGAIPCLYWPVPARAGAGAIHPAGAPPIVVVGSTGDPATPYAWAQHLTAELGTATLVTRHGQGHGAYLVSGCVRAAVDDYLIRLTVPARSGLDCQ